MHENGVRCECVWKSAFFRHLLYACRQCENEFLFDLLVFFFLCVSLTRVNFFFSFVFTRLLSYIFGELDICSRYLFGRLKKINWVCDIFTSLHFDTCKYRIDTNVCERNFTFCFFTVVRNANNTSAQFERRFSTDLLVHEQRKHMSCTCLFPYALGTSVHDSGHIHAWKWIEQRSTQ